MYPAEAFGEGPLQVPSFVAAAESLGSNLHAIASRRLLSQVRFHQLVVLLAE